MDRDEDKDQERDQEQDRLWAATRLTEAAVTQLFQGASTPVDPNRGQQIGQIVAGLYSAIYTGEDVQSKLDARPSLAKRMANVPPRSPVLPRPTMVGQSGPAARPVAGPARPPAGKGAVGKGAVGKGAVGKGAGPAAGGVNLPQSIQNESAEEAPMHQAGVGPPEVQDRTEASVEISEIGPPLGAPPESSQDSLQSLLSEIVDDAPQEEVPEERVAPPPESLFNPRKVQEESLEAQLASIASQGPMEPEIPPPPPVAPTPLPNLTSPKAPSPAPANSAVVVLEAPDKRQAKWRFWKR